MKGPISRLPASTLSKEDQMKQMQLFIGRLTPAREWEINSVAETRSGAEWPTD
jgi:hypothetical protein